MWRLCGTPGVGSTFSFSLKFEMGGPLDDMPKNEVIQNFELQKPTFDGDILVCEDNDINQQVIMGHLSKVGLNATIVENGKLGVDAVKSKKGKPYDLIFMDIHMPVMDGLEASQRLTEMGNTTPVIALTANAMSKDIEAYLNNGMSDYLAKPFVARDLWKCLLKYLTPVSMDNILDEAQEKSHSAQNNPEVESLFDRRVGIEQSGEDEVLYNQLLARFARNNKFTFKNICDAIDAGDTMLAHRLAHTMKGTAGTLGAAKLQEAALAVEVALSDGKTPLPNRCTN